MWAVWESVKNTYPGGTINWDDVPPAEWAYALDGLSQDEIANGLKAMVQEGGSFPPNAPEFRKFCKPDTAWETQAHKIYDNKLLESKRHLDPDNVETGQQVLANLRGMFE